MERIEIWRKIREICGCSAWTNIVLQWLAIWQKWNVLFVVCAFATLVLAGVYFVCDIVYTKKLRALIKKEWGEDGKGED